jgi:lysozyme family protein
MIRALCERRLRFLQGLGTWAVFGRGWGRRVEDVEDRALTLATGQPHFAGG